MSINREIKSLTHLHTGITQPSKIKQKNIIVSSMDGLRFIILSEVSQEGKEIYHLQVEPINSYE